MLKYALSFGEPTRPRRIRFGLLTAEEVEDVAVCKITQTTLYYRGLPASGGLLDPLMGSVDRRHLCATCMRDARNCQGHVGCIQFAYPLYHAGFIDTTLKILRCVCFTCSRLCCTEGGGGEHLTGIKRFNHVYLNVKNRKTCPHCGACRPTYTRAPLGINVMWDGQMQWEDDEHKAYCAIFTAREALSILTHMEGADILALGFDPSDSHPKNTIAQNITVPPPCTRPAIYSTEGSRCRGQNDLTVRFIEILKRNQDVANCLNGRHWMEAGVTDELVEHLQRLQYELFVLVQPMHRVTRPAGMGRIHGSGSTKSLIERLRGKEGRVRGNLMGKRVDFSGRAVITPDAYFDCDRVGVPYAIAKTLTIPEPVTPTNLQSMHIRVRAGVTDLKGARNVLHLDGTITDLAACKKREDIVLKHGEIVERFLQDDDVVVFNRQPSLHLHGMQAHRVVLMPGHTFRLNLVPATPYNADFDGDEMNMHVPQSKAAAAECGMIMAVGQNVLGSQSNKPVMGMVQDALVGLHLLTQNDVLFDHAHACRLFAFTRHTRVALPPPAVTVVAKGRKACSLWTGMQCFSVLLPPSLTYQAPLGNEVTWDPVALPVVIRQGVHLCGTLGKRTVGTAAGGLVDVYCREIGGVATLRFMGECQRMMNAFLLQRGHHVGIQDVMLSPNGKRRVKERLVKVTRLCEEIQRCLQGDHVSMEMKEKGERAILKMLSKMLQQTGGIVDEEMGQRNAIRRMVSSGSKGSFINLSQICACLGQQSLEGARITSNRTRTLPYFAHGDISLASKGMVYSSFAIGLTPTEMFYHGIGGREGLVDTAVKTAQTGYLQRRMNKAMEDHIVRSDGSIRTTTGEIISFQWGADGMHPLTLERATLKILEETDASARGRFTAMEWTVCKGARENMTNVLTHVLTSEARKRVLLPFSPARMREHLASLRRAEGTEVAVERAHVEAELNQLLSIHTSIALKLAIVDVFNYRALRHLSAETVAGVARRIASRVEEAISTTGVAAGALAAQSVGEPATQMTLNTFHTAGVASKNVTLGLPHLKEILDGSRNPKTPCTTLRFHPTFRACTVVVAYLAQTIVATKLQDIVQRATVVDSSSEADGSEAPWLTQVEDFVACLEDEPPTLRYQIRLAMDQAAMRGRHLTPCMVRHVLHEHLAGRASVSCSETNALDWIVQIRIFDLHVPAFDRDRERMLASHCMRRLLALPIGGHPGVSSANASEAQFYTRGDDGVIHEAPEQIVHAYGNILDDAAEFGVVDWYRCTSNNVWEVLRILGVEACVHVLFDELRSVVSFDGTYVDDRHLMLLADTMCRGGTIMPLNRHGMNRMESNPLMRSSFEETADVLCNAAMHAEVEDGEGVTSAIMMGQLARCGTGNVDVRFKKQTTIAVPVIERTKRILRSTCRCPVETPTEALEYVMDEALTRAPASDGCHRRKRIRFRHASPARS